MSKKKVTPTCTLTTWSFQRAAPHTPHITPQHSNTAHRNTGQQHSTATQHSNTAQQHSTATQHSTAVYPRLSWISHHFDMQNWKGNRIAMDSPTVSSRLFSTTLTFRTPQENHIVSVPFETIEKKTKNVFHYFLYLPDTLKQFKT